jgi:hypothetical protein
MDILGSKLAESPVHRLRWWMRLPSSHARNNTLLSRTKAGATISAHPYGLLIAQLALALNGRDRSEVLSQLLELLADRELAGNGGGIAS